MLLILFCKLHFMLWYLSLIAGTITLSQISIGSDPSGIESCFIHKEYKLLRSFGRYSCQFFLRNFSLGYSLSLQKSLISLTKLISSPVHPVLLRLGVLECHIPSNDISNDLFFLFNSVISFSIFLISFFHLDACSCSCSCSLSS